MQEVVIPKFENKHFDKKALKTKFYDDLDSIDFIIEIMENFLQNEFKKEFQNSLESKDLNQFYFIIHKLKGSAAVSCMSNLYQFCLELENINFDDQLLLESKINLLYDEITLVLKLMKE